MMESKPKSLVFRIRKQYYEDIVIGKKVVEYRANTEFWQKRVFGMSESEMNLPGIVQTDFPFKWWVVSKHFERPLIAVFICGKRVHRREIMAIERMPTPAWFSSQGKKDVNTPTCLVFHLGKEIRS